MGLREGLGLEVKRPVFFLRIGKDMESIRPHFVPTIQWGERVGGAISFRGLDCPPLES